MPSIVGRVATADGTDLLVRHWPVWAGTDPVASVLLVHGLGDHSGRFEHVGDHLAAAGFDVHAFDLRGNGGSDGRRGHVDRWSQHHDDLEERVLAVRQAAEGPRPLVLYGHSMGGLVAAGYLLEDRAKPDLVVLTSPGLDSTLPTWKKTVARMLGRIVPTLPIPNGIDGSMLSRDPAVAAKIAVDPTRARVSTTRFGAEALAEQARVRREFARLTLPTLVLHGLDDRLVPATASEVLSRLPNVERRTYPGLRHELHNEPEGLAILDEVIAWIRKHAPLTP